MIHAGSHGNCSFVCVGSIIILLLTAATMSATTRSKSKPAPAKSSKQAPVKGKKRGAPAPPLKRTKSQTGPIPYDNAVDNPDPSSSSSSSNKRRGQTPKRRKGQSPSTPKTPDFDLTVPPQGSPGSSDLDDLDEKDLRCGQQSSPFNNKQLLAKSSSCNLVYFYSWQSEEFLHSPIAIVRSGYDIQW